MDWENLRHFLALAEGGSLSAAARRLKVDHTTVARRVAALEEALNLRLVDRLPRAVMLTPEGERIAQLGQTANEAMFAILRAAEGSETALAGTVCVSAPPVFSSVVLAPRLIALKDRHPGIRVTLLGDTSAADLGHRQADIAIRLSRPENVGLIVRKVGEMPFAFYAAKDYDKPESQWDFIGYDEASADIPQYRWLEARRNGRRVVLRTNDSASQASAARSGLGVALLPAFLGDNDPVLRPMPSTESFPVRDIWILVHDDLRRAPRVRAMMDFLIEIIGETCRGSLR